MRVDGLYDPDRGIQEKAGDKAAVEELARRLKGLPGVDAVEVVGFAVDRGE